VYKRALVRPPACLTSAAIRRNLSLFVVVILPFKLICAAVICYEVLSSFQSSFVIFQSTRYLGSDLVSICHFPPATILIPNQKSTILRFNFSYNIPGQLNLRIGRGSFVVFLVFRFYQTAKHCIAGVTQTRVFPSKDDIVHVWAVNCKMHRAIAARFRIGTRYTVTAVAFEEFPNPNPL